MSTRPDTIHDASSTSPGFDDSTDLSCPEPPDQPRGESPPTDVSWVDRCQRQFDSADTARLRNRTDAENEAMHDGV